MTDDFEPLKYSTSQKIVLDEIPRAWTGMDVMNLFHDELPQFPLVYVHFIHEGNRVYGCPVDISYTGQGEYVTPEITFLCNKDLDQDPELRQKVKEELHERFGISESFGLDEIKASGPEAYDSFWEELWNKHMSQMYGQEVPYGQFYQELFSIIRFVSSWRPKTGKQSELRMLYNFMREFGEDISIDEDIEEWNHVDFKLVPLYDEVVEWEEGDLENFSGFENLMKASSIYWNSLYRDFNPLVSYISGIGSGTVKKIVEGLSDNENEETEFKPLSGKASELADSYSSLIAERDTQIIQKLKDFGISDSRAENISESIITEGTVDYVWGRRKKLEYEWSNSNKQFPDNKQEFIENVVKPIENNEDINGSWFRQTLEDLVDAFNRHPGRSSYFVWSIMTARHSDFREWTEEDIRKLYSAGPRGVSPKVVAIFLQQGFSKENIIPIDEWVKAFYRHTLGFEYLDDEESRYNKPDLNLFFDKFDQLGKLERVMWHSSQANKTNMRNFFWTMWCTRFGTQGNSNLREANPLACYSCKLQKAESCHGYEKISDKRVLITNGTTDQDEIDAEDFDFDISEQTRFVCELEEDTPKQVLKIYHKNNGDVKKIEKIDEFSGYKLQDQKVRGHKGETVTVDKFIDLIDGERPWN